MASRKVQARRPFQVRTPKGSTRSADPSPNEDQESKKEPTDSKVDLSSSDSSQGSKNNEVLPPTGQQERLPLSRQPRPKCPVIYDEMAKDELFKKADPNQSDGEGASQRKGSRDKHKDKPVELVARGRLHKGGSASSWEGKKKGGSMQSSAESGTRGREKARPNSPPPRNPDITTPECKPTRQIRERTGAFITDDILPAVRAATRRPRKLGRRGRQSRMESSSI